jgi:hypothetical protein
MMKTTQGAIGAAIGLILVFLGYFLLHSLVGPTSPQKSTTADIGMALLGLGALIGGISVVYTVRQSLKK